MGGGRYGYWGKEQRRKGAATSRIQRGCLPPAVARRGIPRERSLLLACCPHVTSALPSRVPLVIRSYASTAGYILHAASCSQLRATTPLGFAACVRPSGFPHSMDAPAPARVIPRLRCYAVPALSPAGPARV